jgi:tetratricopeptide (TPR) repeat protein
MLKSLKLEKYLELHPNKIPILKDWKLTQPIVNLWENDIVNPSVLPASPAERYYFGIYHMMKNDTIDCYDDDGHFQENDNDDIFEMVLIGKYCLKHASQNGINEAYYVLAVYETDTQKKLEYALKAYTLGIPNAEYVVGLAYMKDDNREEALKYYLIGIDNRNYHSIIELAMYYIETERDEFEHYYKLMYEHPKPIISYTLKLADKLVEMNHMDKARNLYQYCIERNDHDLSLSLSSYIKAFPNVEGWLTYFVRYGNQLEVSHMWDIIQIIEVESLNDFQIIDIFKVVIQFEVVKNRDLSINYFNLVRKGIKLCEQNTKLLCQIKYHLKQVKK